MRNYPLLSLFGLAFTTLSAFTETWSPLPIPEYADTEVRTNVAMRAWSTDIQKLRFELVFDASPSNNLEVAFGTDRNEDGFLSCQESGLIIGWDCGEWFIRNAPTGLRISEEATTGSRKKLVFEMYVSKEGVPTNMLLTDGENKLFHDRLKPPPEWFFSPKWNTMSLTARGMHHPNERFEVETASDGFIIFFR